MASISTGALSQWMTLAPEILSEIFLHSIPFPEEKRFARPSNGPTIPAMFSLGISHVCRQWRQAAIGYSRLWSFLDLVQSADQSAESRALQLIATYLQRSGLCQLTIVLTYEYSTRHVLLAQLLQQSSRWVTIYFDAYCLHMASPTSVGPSIEWSQIKFPLLKNVVKFDSGQQVESFNHGENYRPLMDIFQTSNLQRYYNYCSNDVEEDELVYLLDSVVRLRYCFQDDIADVFTDPNIGPQPWEFAYDRLEYASLRVESDILRTHGQGFLHHFDFPNLRGLNLRVVNPFARPNLFARLPNMNLPGYFPNLRVLRICGDVYIDRPTLQNMFNVLAQLTDLTLDLLRSTAMVDNVVELLTPQAGVVRLPQMEHLRISMYPHHHLTLLVTMVSLRFGGLPGAVFAPLRSFMLVAPPDLQAAFSVLTQLRLANGWDIGVKGFKEVDLWEDAFGGEFCLDI
ncbi:hypothetical protein MIND_01105400 [Mycena indigotica]|uniref:F-box domain-containing protein n=1 Tax=Mycena indigotica TaxID=2126181 RepID=A0A8H6VVQ5_9AGAR|nr:uncharacterized protein MIND_01105400 [Mycena indigotica]KAF7295652.1 hypothetical protein MIND_01105400 [Mycena indigotica]